VGGFTDRCVNRRSSTKEARLDAKPPAVNDRFKLSAGLFSLLVRSFEAVPLANAIVYIVSSLRLRRSQKLVRDQLGEPCREPPYSLSMMKS